MFNNSPSLADIAAVTRNNNGSGNGGGNGFLGGDGWWALILLLALFGGFGGGFGGFGGFGGGMMMPWMMMPWMMGGWGREGNCASQEDLAMGFNNSAVISKLNDLTLGQAGLQQSMSQGFHGVDNAICTLGYNNQAGVNELSHQISDCCCQNLRALDGVNFNMAKGFCDLQNTLNNNTRDLMESQNAGTRAILDFLTQDKISTLTAENQSLKFAASQAAQNAFITANQEAQTAELIRRLGRDCPTPSYLVPNPNCCYTPQQLGFGGNGGNGCNCGF